MAKTHRGTGLKEQVKGGRGTCPVCGRTGIKVLYEVGEENDKKVVCKECNKNIKNKAK